MTFGVAQLVARPTRDNMVVPAARGIEVHVPVPPDIDSMLRRSCRDCHSDATRWPWYAYVAPVSWLVARDVRMARADLDFSAWSSDTVREPTPDQRLGGICHDVRNGIMPPRGYLLMHRRAPLSDGQKVRLCQWTAEARAALRPD